MKAAAPTAEIKCWNQHVFNVGFTSYTLQHHNFPRHFHEHYVIELVTQGADKFYCSGKTYIAAPNQLVFINPGEVHTGSTVADKPLHYYSISPGRKELQYIASMLEKSLPDDFCFQHSIIEQSGLANNMLSLFRAILFSSVESLHCEESFLNFMNDVIDGSCKTHDNFKGNANDMRIRKVIDFMYASFTNPITLQQMAEEVRVSPFHLIRLFKAATGLSPYEYLLILRIEYAKQLLQKGRSVQDAAWEAGFYDTSHFNRLFRKLSGATPKIFRSSK